jgi:hypothetical protein
MQWLLGFLSTCPGPERIEVWHPSLGENHSISRTGYGLDHRVHLIREGSIRGTCLRKFWTTLHSGPTIRSRGGFMRIPRFLFLAALTLACAIPAVAQDLLYRPSASSESQMDGLIAPPEFRPRTSAAPQVEQGWIRATSSQRLPHILRYLPKAEEDDSTCLYIRTYRVTRDDPESDATSPAGYSTCQSAARFQTKRAVEILQVEPR